LNADEGRPKEQKLNLKVGTNLKQSHAGKNRRRTEFNRRRVAVVVTDAVASADGSEAQSDSA
jgi:hypothetical protein